MIDLFQTVACIYTKKDTVWVDSVDSSLSPVVINKFLGMNVKVLKFARWLDKYVYFLSLKSYLLLAWSVIPKQTKPPFVKFLKPKEDDEVYAKIIGRVRDRLELGDNDFIACKRFLLKSIEDDKVGWFKLCGLDKNDWKDAGLDYNLMKDGGVRKGKSGLDLFM